MFLLGSSCCHIYIISDVEHVFGRGHVTAVNHVLFVSVSVFVGCIYLPCCECSTQSVTPQLVQLKMILNNSVLTLRVLIIGQ